MKIVVNSGYLLLCIFFANAVFAQNSSKNYVDGELLVKYKSGVSLSRINSLNARISARTVEKFSDLQWQRVKLTENTDLDEAIKHYQELGDVESVQPNFYYHLLNTPNDKMFPDSGMYGLTKISAPSAWDLTTGSSSVVVADIDTGLRYTHEDLAANAWKNPGEIPNNGIDDDGNGFVDDYYGWDFFYNDSDPIDDAGGHGTHTAGTIGAVGNNNLGVTGVNWNVKIMAIKIYSPNGGDSTSAMLVNAYNYVRMMKNRGVNIRVTNNSYGDCGEACGYDQATKDALDAMGDAGILNVFAAGNKNSNIDSTPFYPASYTSPSILSVAASDQNDSKAVFSNYGAVSVDVAAPGVGITSTFNNSDSSYATFSGTSMATPMTTGAAALLSAYNPNLSVASLKATLMNTVDVLPQWNGLVKTGGRINVARALQNQTVCYALDKNLITAPTKGGTFSVTAAIPANCETTAKSLFAVAGNLKWISLSGTSFSGSNVTITFRVAVNQAITRTAAISIGGQNLVVRQSRNN